MQREVVLGGQRIVYELQRRRVKGIRLRVRRDGSVAVSAPPLVPVLLIEQFLAARQDWLREALRRTTAAREEARDALRDGGTVYVWGQPLTLRLRAGKRDAALRDGDSLILTLRDRSDSETAARTLEAWRKKRCAETLTALCRRYYPAFELRGAAFPSLSFRRMSSRWGSCRPQKGALSFNTRLTELPESCAAYVVVHELAHFLHPDHSAAFYAEVAQVLPDWRERRAAIRAWEKEHPL